MTRKKYLIAEVANLRAHKSVSDLVAEEKDRLIRRYETWNRDQIKSLSEADETIGRMNKLIDVLTRDHTLDLDTYRAYWNSARHADDETPEFGEWLVKKYEEDVAEVAQQRDVESAKKRLGIR